VCAVIGQTVSHYKIIEKIGEGGMGVVYKAVDQKLRRYIALKFLPAGLLENSESRQRFIREAQAAAALNHPNIITVYEINDFDGQMFIAMEFVDGMYLHRKIAEKNHDRPGEGHILHEAQLDYVVNLFIQLAEGLHKAHGAGIVHRDIKPQNILVDGDDRVKILDFGIAKLRGMSQLTQKAFTMGTVPYMSPEQVKGRDLDHRSDIWSLGVLLYEMLADRLPFNGEYPETVIYSIVNEKPELLSTAKAGVPTDVERVVNRALVKDPAHRYQGLDEMIKDLRGVASRFTSETMTEVLVPTQEDDNRISIAVLPFADMSPQKDQEYFCDGMVEELINSLSKIDGLKVASRTSSFFFKGKNCELQEIGGKLKVKTVLEGGVQKAGDRLRVTAHLVNVEDGCQLWSERFDGELQDVFAVQDEITMAIVENLKVKLLGEEKEEISKRHTNDLEAYNLFLQGRYFWNKRYEGGMKKSIEFFQQSSQRDPNYALPFVGIADAFNILGFYGFMPPKEAFQKARASARRALQIDEHLGEAHSSLGWVKTFFEWDWAGAEREFKRAIELNPHYATSHEWYALFLGVMGRFEEALREISIARDHDPLSLIINSVAGVLFIFARRYDKAIKQLNRTIEMDPTFALAHIWLGEAYMFSGMYEEAEGEFKKVLSQAPNMTYALADLGMTYGFSGRKEEARNILKQFDAIAEQAYLSMVLKAQVFIGLGMKDEAFAALDQAYEDRDSFVPYFKASPHYDRLRPDPRFEVMLIKVNQHS
jgi:serine/threonine-protein kinase